MSWTAGLITTTLALAVPSEPVESASEARNMLRAARVNRGHGLRRMPSSRALLFISKLRMPEELRDFDLPLRRYLVLRSAHHKLILTDRTILVVDEQREVIFHNRNCSFGHGPCPFALIDPSGRGQPSIVSFRSGGASAWTNAQTFVVNLEEPHARTWRLPRLGRFYDGGSCRQIEYEQPNLPDYYLTNAFDGLRIRLRRNGGFSLSSDLVAKLQLPGPEGECPDVATTQLTRSCRYRPQRGFHCRHRIRATARLGLKAILPYAGNHVLHWGDRTDAARMTFVLENLPTLRALGFSVSKRTLRALLHRLEIGGFAIPKGRTRNLNQVHPDH